MARTYNPYKRVYYEKVKRAVLDHKGISATGTGVTLLIFWYLAFVGAITVTWTSGDMHCGLGDYDCMAEIHFCALKDVYIYPNESWNFYTEGSPRDVIMKRSWGSSWRTIDLSHPWSSQVKYAVKFAMGQCYEVRFYVDKSPWEELKWGFGDIDPMFLAISDVKVDEVSPSMKRITFPNLTRDYNIKEMANLQGKETSELMNVTLKHFYGKSEVNLRVYKNVTRGQDVPYDCDCSKILVNGTHLEEVCKTCIRVENITTRELVGLDPDNFILNNKTEIYEVSSGCKEIGKEQWGCSSWSDVNVLGGKVKGATFWDTSWAKCRNWALANPTSQARNYYPVKANVTDITFVNVFNELVLVNTSCDNGGSVKPSQVILNGSDYSYSIGLINISAGANLNWSWYYNNTGAPVPDYSGETNLVAYDKTHDVVFNSQMNITFVSNGGVLTSWLDIPDGSPDIIGNAVFGGWNLAGTQIFLNTESDDTCTIVENGSVYVQINCTAGENASYVNSFEFFDKSYFIGHYIEAAGNPGVWMEQMYGWKMDSSVAADWSNWSNGSLVTQDSWTNLDTDKGWYTGYRDPGAGATRFGFEVWDEDRSPGQKQFNTYLGSDDTLHVRVAVGASGSTGTRHATGDYRSRWGVRTDDNASDEYTMFTSDITYYIGHEQEQVVADDPPVATLITPANYATDADGNVTFNCTCNDDQNCTSISFWMNATGTMVKNQTKSTIGDGTYAERDFYKNLLDHGEQTILWSCSVADNNTQYDFPAANWSVTIDMSNQPTWVPDEDTDPRLFTEGWESGAINTTVWETWSSDISKGRIRVTSLGTPNTGNFHILMDVSSSGENRNAIITENGLFDGAKDLDLEFWHKEFSEEDDDCPASWTGYDPGASQGDCVAFTCTNNTWYKAVDLAPAVSSWTKYTYNFSDHANWCGTANDTFKIWFGQDDNVQYSTDGFAYDDINITYTATATYTVTLALNGSASNTTYELGYPAFITANVTNSSVEVCINITGIGDDLNCSDGEVSLNWTADAVEWRFNDSTIEQNLTDNFTFGISIYSNLTRDIENAEINLTGSTQGGDYPKDVKIDIGDDGNIDSYFMGNLINNDINLEEFNDSSAAVNTTFGDAEYETLYVELPNSYSMTSAGMEITGYKYGDGVVKSHTNVVQFPYISITGLWDITIYEDLIYVLTGNRVLRFNKDSILYHSTDLINNVGSDLLGASARGICYNGSHFFISNISGRIHMLDTDLIETGYSFVADEDAGTHTLECNATHIYVAEYPYNISVYKLSDGSLTEQYNIWADINSSNSKPWTGISFDDDFFYTLDETDDMVYIYDREITASSYSFDVTYGPTNVIHGMHVDDYYIYTVGNVNSSTVYVSKYWKDHYPTNVLIDVGNDGILDWTSDNSTSAKEIVDLNITAIDNYLDSSDCGTPTCDVPIVISVNSTGILQTDSLNVTYEINTVLLNTTAILDYFNTSENVPYRITANTWGTILFDDVNITYYGAQNYTQVRGYVVADTGYTSSNTVLGLNVRYSNITVDYPPNVYWYGFYPPNATYYNVTPFGQTDTQPAMNITTYNYADDVDVSIKLNGSTDACLDFTISTTSNVYGHIMDTDNWVAMSSSGYAVNQSFWYFLNMTDCNNTVGWFDYWEFIEPCCSSCNSCW